MAHRVVIIGGGFGGLYAARALKRSPDVEITLIDRRNFHLFQPLLYQVATGELSPADIAFPLRAVFSRQRNTKVLLAEAIDLDPAGKRVILRDGEVHYDTLIVASGSRNSYFGNDHWQAEAPGLKTLEEATLIRHRILYAFEAAEGELDEASRKAWMTFVVIGGGPTGVELAGALGEIANDTLKHDFRSIDPECANIYLVDGGKRLLSNLHPDLSNQAEHALIKLGVRTRVEMKVVGVDDFGVDMQTADGRRERIETRTALWAAGVSGSRFAQMAGERLGGKLDRAGRIEVDSECHVPGHPDIYIVGDIALSKDKDGKPLPGVAPTAMQQGQYAAKSILRKLRGEQPKPFSYFDKGSLAVIGRASAVAQFGDKFRFSGVVAWLLWLFVHLMYLVSFQNRLIVFIRWGFNYLTLNRGARLITGDPESAFSMDGQKPETLSPDNRVVSVREPEGKPVDEPAFK